MATLAPYSATPVRKPFGVLDGSKLRSLQSIKNCQNGRVANASHGTELLTGPALSTASAPSSLKRRHVSPDNSDSENVDPDVLKSLNKRKRADFADDVSTSKSARYSLSTVPSSKPLPFASSNLTPRLDTGRAIAPASAPAAAGRSPTRSKHRGTLPRKRFAPPQFGTRAPPVSIAAALSGTLAHKKSKKIRRIDEYQPKSWFFDIYEETEAQQDYTVKEWTMTQSATILDISDDEGKAQDRADRGKENIPPNDVPVVLATTTTTTQSSTLTKVPSSRKDMMTDELRTPLGDLNAADYYPEGLDASSVVLVQDDAAEPEKASGVEEVVVAGMAREFTFGPDTIATTERPSNAVDLSLLLTSSTTSFDVQKGDADDATSGAILEPADIEIWESESAKDEKEEEAADSIFAV